VADQHAALLTQRIDEPDQVADDVKLRVVIARVGG